MLITTGIAAPFEDPAGTSTLTWYSPTAPGAKPENRTAAGLPPMDTAGVVVVDEIGSLSAGEPLAGWLVTGPRPVQYIWITVLPAVAGFDPSTKRYDVSRIAP
jgi:hypothetical protein